MADIVFMRQAGQHRGHGIDGVVIILTDACVFTNGSNATRSILCSTMAPRSGGQFAVSKPALLVERLDLAGVPPEAAVE